jgi:hypothetical protein
LLALPGFVRAMQSPQRPSFRAGTEVVTIDVSVRRKAAPVPGLTAADFVLLDNGVPQRVSVETTEAVPVDVSAAFEMSTTSQFRQGGRFASDLKELVRLLRPIDRLRVITFARDVREVMPLLAPASLLKSGSIDGALSVASAQSAASSFRSESGRDFRYRPTTRYNRTALSDAVLLALVQPPDPERRRIAIVYATGLDGGSLAGKDLLSPIAGRSDALLEVALWNWNGLVERRSGLLGFTRLELARAAEATGGEARDSRDVVKTFASVLKDFRRRYLLRYTVTGVPRTGWHDVTVRIPAHPEYTIHHRRGYVGD